MDVETISLIIGIIGILETLALFVSARLVQRYPSIHWWAVGRALNAAGSLLIATRAILPLDVVVIASISCLVLALLPTLIGVNRFIGVPRRRQELAAVALGVAVVATAVFFTLVIPNPIARTFVAMAIAAALNLMAAWSLSQPTTPQLRRIYRAAAVVALIYGVWLIVRAALTLADGMLNPAFNIIAVHRTTLIGMLGAVGLWTIAMIAVIVQRLLLDLQRAQESERATLRQAAAELEQAYLLSREREELFRLTFDQSPLGAAIVSATGTFLRVNATLGQIAQRPAAELIGLELATVVHAEDLSALVSQLRTLVGGQAESFSSELRFATPGQPAVWVKVSARRVLTSADDQPTILLLADDITERKRTEQRLRVIEHQQQLTLRTIPVQFWIKDAEGRYLIASDRLCAFHGYGPGELVGRTPEEIYSPELAAFIRAGDQQVLREGARDYPEALITDHAGQRRWLDSSRAPVYDEGGALIGIIGVSRDVTERKQQEEALRRSREQLELALWGGELAIWDWDVPSNTLQTNGALAAGLAGLIGGDIGPDATVVTERIHPDDIAEVFRVFRTAIGTGASIEVEYRIGESGEGWRWLMSRGRVVAHDEQGRALRLVGVTQDVTARRTAEEALRERETMLRAIGDNLPDAMVYQLVRSPEGRDYFTYVSAGVRQISGLTPEQVYAQPSAIRAQHAPEGIEYYNELTAHSERHLTDFDYEMPKLMPDGSRRWSHLRSRPRRQPDGSTVWDGVEIDITERKRIDAQLRRRIDELVTLNQISQALTNWTDMPTRLETVGRLLRSLFGAASVALWEHAPHGVLHERMRIGGAVEPARREIAVAESGIAQRVLEDNAGLIDWMNSDPLLRDESAPGAPSGILVVPLQTRGAALGVLVMTPASEAQVYTPADLALAQTIAGTLATAIENTRLVDEAQQLAVERERRRIAQDLHDSVNQTLLAAARTAELVPRIWELDPEEGHDALLDLRRLTRSALDEMRALVVELYPRALTDAPLHESLRHLAPAASAKTGAMLETDLSPTPILPPNVQVAMYRIAQEAINNACRHAHARRVAISLSVSPPINGVRWAGEVTVRVADDGQGFDLAASPPGRMGLTSMRERAADIGATLAIHSHIGGGTTITATWRGNATAAKETPQP